MNRERIDPRAHIDARQEAVDRAVAATERWAKNRQTPGSTLIDDNEYFFVNSNIEDYENMFSLSRGHFYDFLRNAQDAHPERPVRVLDYGCGTGEALRDLARFSASQGKPIHVELTGINAGDPRSKEEKAEDEKLGIRYKVKTRAAFTPELNHYDLIVSSMTFTHLYDPLADLTKLYSALRPGGVIYTDFTIGELAKKFYAADPPDRAQSQQAIDDALEVFTSLAKKGIDIALTKGRIVKNDVPMEFPDIERVTPLDNTGQGLYELVRDSVK